jgi:hypothetical protein
MVIRPRISISHPPRAGAGCAPDPDATPMSGMPAVDEHRSTGILASGCPVRSKISPRGQGMATRSSAAGGRAAHIPCDVTCSEMELPKIRPAQQSADGEPPRESGFLRRAERCPSTDR